MAPPTQHGAAGGDFARLLEAEARLEALIAAAREEARGTVQAAREEAARRSGLIEREIADRDKALAEEVESRLKQGAAEIQSGTRTDLARYGAIPAARTATLARYVVDRLVTADS